MANANALVGRIVEIRRDEQGHTIELEGGRSARLDAKHDNAPGLARVLDALRARGAPVYLETDGARAVTHVRLPLVSRVAGVRALEDGSLAVELEDSHARHVIPRAAPDAAEMERTVLDAERTGRVLLVTVDDRQEVVDVREFVAGPEGPPLPFDEPEPRTPRPWLLEVLWRVWRWCWWPWRWWSCWWRGCISSTYAQQVFDAMSATTCDPLAVPPPCIPFLYPDDGCWGRAHEMCRLMRAMGLSPRKVWIDGALHVNTKNNPTCHVDWHWHVAPTLCVRGPRRFQKRTMVIDPSLFTAPVTEATWKSVQGDPNATLTETDWTQFSHGGGTDPTFSGTNGVLATYRTFLQLRSLQVGPPPYANCP